jgi:hypothetical protein
VHRVNAQGANQSQGLAALVGDLVTIDVRAIFHSSLRGPGSSATDARQIRPDFGRSIGRIDDMGTRIDGLERSIGELMVRVWPRC